MQIFRVHRREKGQVVMAVSSEIQHCVKVLKGPIKIEWTGLSKAPVDVVAHGHVKRDRVVTLKILESLACKIKRRIRKAAQYFEFLSN